MREAIILMSQAISPRVDAPLRAHRRGLQARHDARGLLGGRRRQGVEPSHSEHRGRLDDRRQVVSYLMREASRGRERQAEVAQPLASSEAIRGHQRSSEVFRGLQRSSDAISASSQI
jgi:hypothetical protein